MRAAGNYKVIQWDPAAALHFRQWAVTSSWCFLFPLVMQLLHPFRRTWINFWGIGLFSSACLWPLTVLILQNQTWLIIRLLKKISKSSCLDYLQLLPMLAGESLAEWDKVDAQPHGQAWYLFSMRLRFGKCFLATLTLFSLVQSRNGLI